MRRLLALFLLFQYLISYSQKETSNWFLYQNRISVTPSGVTTGLPVPNYTALNPLYASTSVSDSAGNLLFACDGNKIIDRNLSVMPALANISFYCGNGEVLAQKIPNSTKYYVFYTSPKSSVQNSPWILKYAIVDLSLNGGSGDVTIYNQVIDTALSKGFTLAQGSNTEDAWLITHHNATDTFLTYKITRAGISNTPVTSMAGTNAFSTDYNFQDLKTSHDGTIIAGISYTNHTVFFAYTTQFVEVFNFDPILGKLTNRVRSQNLGIYFLSYNSVEFSPDNRLVYAGMVTRVDGLQPCGFGSGTVIQFNTCYTDSIQFTRYSMRIANDFQFCNYLVTWGNIQLGADKRIHMPYTGINVSTINNPNRIGSSANYVFNSYQLPVPNFAYIVTPGFQHRLLEKAVKNNIVYKGGCLSSPVSFSITNDTISGVLWNFGDPASGSNTSSSLNPSHIFSAPGIYTVTAQLYNSQSKLIEPLTELVEIKDAGKRILYNYPRDTVFCEGNSMNIKLNVINGIFHWYQLTNGGVMYNSMVADSMNINYSGTYYVEMHQNDCNGCIMLDSIHVTVLPTPNFNLGNDRTLCSGDSMQLTAYTLPADYMWNTGDTTNSIWIYRGGPYWVQAEFNHNGCPQRDSIIITEVPPVQFSLPNDTILCNNQTLLLNPGVTNASYLWQNGSTQNAYTVAQPGTYWVTVTGNNSCRKADTIQVSYINAQQVFLGNDTTLCEGDSVILHSNIAGAQYLWSNGSTSDHITVNQTGIYWINVLNGNCAVADSIQIIFHAPPVLFFGNDTSLCEHDRLVLNTSISNASYLWQNGSQANLFTITQPGTYWLRVQQYGCTVSDTINIEYYTVPPINLGADINICNGDSVVLNAGNGFNQYLWNNGTVTQQITVHDMANYSIIGTTADGCHAYDTIRVNVFALPSVHLNHDSTLCTNDTRLLDAGSGFVSYRWNDGTTSRTKTATNTGLYAVTVTDNNGCRESDTTIITRLLSLPKNFLPSDTVICSYGTLKIQPQQSFRQYLWSNNATTPRIEISQPGIYWLQVTDNDNCKGKDSIIVNHKDCMEGLYVPTAFTPNNDGKNDLFKPLLFGKILQYRFTIYNRWGEIIFETYEPSKGWNGTYNGVQLETNVFVWVCSYQLEGEESKTKKGTLLLIR